MNKILIFFALLIILIFGVFYFLYQSLSLEETSVIVPVQVDNKPKLVNSETFVCNQGKTINASFYEGVTTTTQVVGEQPTVTGSVTLMLSDERTLDLAQTISADGGRYASVDNAFVFWNKGNGALVLENGGEKDYISCVVVSKQVTGVDLPKFFADTNGTFSLRLPNAGFSIEDGYVINEAFKRELSPANIIDGVQFTIPASIATGTNLSNDSYLSIEHIPDTLECKADLFLDDTNGTSTVNETGLEYSFASSSGAASGNRYEEMVYAIKGTNPCIGIRYFVHYVVFENFEEGTVKKFDQKTLLTSFDQIRRSLVVNQ